jgi:hypothetical protein
MRKVIVATTLLAACVAIPGIAVTPAAATGFSDVEVCTVVNVVVECMNGYDGDFGIVKTYPYTPGAAQDMSVDPVNYAGCGSTVTDTCPFTSTALDERYEGDSLVSFFNDTNGKVYRDLDGTGTVVETTGGGTGQVWVQHLSLEAGTASFVNIYATNPSGTPVFACSLGTGDDLALSSYTDPQAGCIWNVNFGS